MKSSCFIKEYILAIYSLEEMEAECLLVAEVSSGPLEQLQT